MYSNYLLWILPWRVQRGLKWLNLLIQRCELIVHDGFDTDEQRLQKILDLEHAFQQLQNGENTSNLFIKELYQHLIQRFQLPEYLILELFKGFKEAILTHRYTTFGEWVSGCRSRANPVGRIYLLLSGEQDSHRLAQSDGIYTAMALIDDLCHIQRDWQQHTIRLPIEDMQRFSVTETQLTDGEIHRGVQQLIQRESERAFNMLKAGSPLGKYLRGRVGWFLRWQVLVAQCRLQKLAAHDYRIPQGKPQLDYRDYYLILKRSLLKK